MSAGIESINHTVHQTNTWIHDLDERLGWENRARSYRVLRAVLHVLRDWLPIDEGANLSAQLPTLLRGVFYDQWRPSAVPAKERSLQAFLNRVEELSRPDPPRDMEWVVGAVFELLADKVTPGEIEDVRDSLPKDLRALWPLGANA
jgi:uncharacterized protein (DUF2267 family)